ncbi:alginate lyase 2 [Penicillium riverlandense]|uniref:alginate lyase 2 n=1 Tax=Penicillium riverlandense TaxID=1903569 RepID=UPI002546B5AF|nr:alginate lyase 2 [Penicillium riverlandense]KAJ5825735.1 alginate lyase 2 [Penicillium riverlandense]
MKTNIFSSILLLPSSVLVLATPMKDHMHAIRAPSMSSSSSSSATPSGTKTSCAPGGYMSALGDFDLQLPIAASSGGSAEQISATAVAGCSGYQNPDWFYWNTASSYLVMKAPPTSTPCAKTSGSKHCRTELREADPSSWSPSGTNTMTVKLKVAQADDGDYGTVIGQVFSASFSKPIIELYYNPQGVVTVGLETTTAGGDENFTKIGTIPENTVFTYELNYSNDELTVSLNGGTANHFSVTPLGTPDAYFKAGDYNQGDNVASEVDIYSIDVVHS